MSNPEFHEIHEAVLGESEQIPTGAKIIKGYDFNQGTKLEEILNSYGFMGFQATNYSTAVEIVNEMVRELINGKVGLETF